jgi:hypothetical protein
MVAYPDPDEAVLLYRGKGFHASAARNHVLTRHVRTFALGVESQAVVGTADIVIIQDPTQGERGEAVPVRSLGGNYW